MLRRILPGTLVVWEIAMGIGLQQGLFDEFPRGVVAVALTVPPLIFFSTRETVRRCTNRRPLMSLILFLVVFLLAGGAAWLITFKTKKPNDSGGQNDHAVSEQLAAQGKRLDSLTEALTRNPNVEADAKLKLLQEEQDRLSKKSEAFTEQEKETFDKQALTLQALEESRKRDLEAEEVRKQQAALATQQREIEKTERLKQSQKEIDGIEIEFAKQHAPLVAHALSTLYQMLRQIAKESGETLTTDLPNDRPSLDGSNLSKDGKLRDGQHIIRVGESKDWEFRLKLYGALTPDNYHQGQERPFFLEVRAGLASILIRPPLRRSEEETLRFEYWVDPRQNYRRMGLPYEKPLMEEECALAECQKPVERFLMKLIQNRYVAAPLKPKS
jgi:hypothetical protein